MPRLRYLLATALVVLTTLAAVPGAALAQTDAIPSPQAALYHYYTAINMQDYATAYGMWANPTQTLDAFQNGFSTTQRVVPYFGAFESAQAALSAGTVRAVLLGYETDGSVQTYTGCFNLGLNNARWLITGSNFVQVMDTTAPDQASVDMMLQQPCSADATTLPLAPKTASAMDGLLLNYYDLINAGQYDLAYAMWLQPIPGPKPNGQPAEDYRPPFEAFRTGYGNTSYVYVYPGDAVEGGAAAGHSYLDGYIPAVLVGQQTDGSLAAYYGCYVTGFLPDGTLGIVNGRFFLFEMQAPTAQEIQAHLGTDCPTLAIPY
jgi:hypothetical protein